MHNETKLITRLQNKDESALSEIYDNYSGALYGIIIRMCKDEGEAQNLLQDTFLSIWEKSHQYDISKGRFYTWAYRIAKNKTLNYLRKSKGFIQTEDLSVYINEADNDDTLPDYLRLNGAINKLSKHHQKALELVYFKGLTHREAHEVMDVPLGTFKSYVKQALKKLQDSYIKILVLIFVLIM